MHVAFRDRFIQKWYPYMVWRGQIRMSTVKWVSDWTCASIHLSNVLWTCPAVHHVVHLLLLLLNLLVWWACHWQRGQGAMCLCQLLWVIGCPIVRTWNHPPTFHSAASPVFDPASTDSTRKKVLIENIWFYGIYSVECANRPFTGVWP